MHAHTDSHVSLLSMTAPHPTKTLSCIACHAFLHSHGSSQQRVMQLQTCEYDTWLTFCHKLPLRLFSTSCCASHCSSLSAARSCFVPLNHSINIAMKLAGVAGVTGVINSGFGVISQNLQLTSQTVLECCILDVFCSTTLTVSESLL